MSVEQRVLQLEQNQKQIINKVMELLNANNSNTKAVKDLRKRVEDGEKLDAKQEAALNSLKNVGKSIEEAEKVVGPAEVIPKQ
jgi:acyl-homoserine lactone acylase PvdQ